MPSVMSGISFSLFLSLISGIAAEGLRYDEVMGQTADLSDLQRILLRSKTKLSAQQQQNITRWAMWRAAMLLKQYAAEHKVRGLKLILTVSGFAAVAGAAAATRHRMADSDVQGGTVHSSAHIVDSSLTLL